MNEERGEGRGSAGSTAGTAGASRLAHGLVVLAALLAGAALLIDPSAGGDLRATGQRQVARHLLFAASFGLIGLWLLRGVLADDLRAVASRWQSPQGAWTVDRLVPSLDPRSLALGLWTVAILWAGVVVIGLWRQSPWLHDLTFENGPLETLTVACYLGGFVVSGLALLPIVGRGRRGIPRRWWWLLAAAGCFLIAAEETDWGQTYLRYETPEAIGAANIQGDFSLHNMALPESVGVTRWANALLRILGWSLGGGLALLLVAVPGFRRLVWSLDAPVPPWWSMLMLFAGASIPRVQNVYDRENVGSELREVTIAAGVFVWLWVAWRASRRSAAES